MNVLFIIFIFIAGLSGLARPQDSPYYPRDTKSNQDLGALNQNFQDVASRSKDKLTSTLTPSSCPTGQALTGAFFNKYGGTFGGICSVVASTITSAGFWANNGNDIYNLNTGNVGVGTQFPATTFDVNGNAQFGSGSNKSTFTTTGSLAMPSGASITDLFNSANSLLATNGSSVYTSLPVLGDHGLVMGVAIGFPSTGTLTGTSNQVIVTNNTAPENITLSLPQNINAGASPTFVAETLTGVSSNTVLAVNNTSTTVSIPQMDSGGIIIGSGIGKFPSTGTITGTASEITVTVNGAPSAINLATAGQTTTCGSGNALIAATYNGGVATGGTCNNVLSGNGSLTGNNDWYGTNNFHNSVTVSSGVILGDINQANKPQFHVYAKSIDGANQSGGCLGIVGENSSSQLTWTSTTTSSAVGKQGITVGSCNAGSVCEIAVGGQVLVTETGATTFGDQVITTATRCQGSQTVGVGTNSMGYILRAIGGAGTVDVFY